MAQNTPILGKIKSSESAASLDAKYGPYASKAAADAALGENGDDVITAGLTVGITQSDGSVKEFWYQPDGHGGFELVEKQVAAQEETDPTVPTWAKQETKPSYTASEVGAIPDGDKGVANGVATLGSDGKVPQSQLPSYVDDVLEYPNQSSFPATGESGKIYVALDTNKTYRWGGSAYVEISQSLALGETSSTAFAGDRGKAIEDKIPSNASSSNKMVTASDLNGKVDKVANAQENNFASFDSNGGIQDSGFSDKSFIKGVQQNGTDLNPDASGKVNVTVQDGEDGLSAFEIAQQQQGYTGTVDQWLASLKANIGAFKFITPTDTTAEAALTAIGSTYASAIGGISPSQTTLSIILLMNDSNNTKTMMIATQEVTPATTPASYEFVYAGDLQSAMPSNVVTTDMIDDEPTAGSNNLVKSGGVKNAISELSQGIDDVAQKVSNIKNTKEEFFYLTDEEGNIGMKYDSNGLDAKAVSEHFIGIVTSTEKSRAEGVEEQLGNSISNVETNLSNQIEAVKKGTGINPVAEDGFHIIDADKNIGFSIIPNVTEDEGLFDIDSEGNIGKKVKGSVHTFSGLDSPEFKEAEGVLQRINAAKKEVDVLKDEMNGVAESLLPLNNGNNTTKTTTIPAAEVKNNRVIRLRLHYGTSMFTPDNKDIFFEGNCKTDFSDVRFFDSNGNILKAAFGEAFNMDVLKDDNIGQYHILVTSDGYIIRYGPGIEISKDNGANFTLIPNTRNITEHGSDVYGYKSMQPLMLDSNDNIFAYAGGKLYKLLAQDDYATINEVLDFSWVNDDSETVYPDVQPHAMTIDINGNIYIGTYAKTNYYHIDVFVSTDGGNTFTRKYFTDYSLTGETQQHVHHIHADKYTSNVYVGIDGGIQEAQGPTVIKTSDGGNTWTDITTQLKQQRGHDYYPTYFGTNYKLGGGENYVLGGSAIVRGNSADNDLESVHKGFGGVRSITDFGNDDVIVAGVQCCRYNSENQIVISKDKGITWKPILRYDQPARTSSGIGFRTMLFTQVALPGETEPCVIACGQNANPVVTPTFRLYNGGQHYYREVEVLLEDVTENTDFTITAKTGYSVPYPKKNVRPITGNSSMVYRIPLNEGYGRHIADSLGNVAVVDGKIEWEKEGDTMRQGEYAGTNTFFNLGFTTAAKIKGAANFGRIAALNFSYNYTINFWCNEKARKCNYPDEDRHATDYISDGIVHVLAKFGNCMLVQKNSGYALIPANGSGAAYHTFGETLKCSDYYSMITFVVLEDTVKAFVNGAENEENALISWTGYKNALLSTADFILGSDNSDYGYITDFAVYNKVLSNSEILNMYKGFNY